MTKKVFRSILLVAATVLLASLVIIMGCLYDYFGSVQEGQLNDALELAAVGVEKLGEPYLEDLDSQRYRVTWIASDGAVLYDNQTDAAGMENHAAREEVRQALDTGRGESIRYSVTLLEKTIYCAKRLPDGTVLRVSVSRETAGMLAMGMLQPVLIVMLVTLILAGVLTHRISKRIVDPLNTLNLDKPLENDTYAELSPLLCRLNRQQQANAEQLRQLTIQRDEFSQIIASMQEGLVLLDGRYRIVSINPTARRLFGAPNDCAGVQFLSVERSRDIQKAIDMALAEGHSEIRLERGGRSYQLDISRIASEGTVIGAVLLSFDVSEQEQAERARREFTANVSHELKTPLQSIMGSAELIENKLVKPEDLPRFVSRIRKEAARLVTLINDIIRLSQLDEGAELPSEQVHLLALAQEVSADLAKAAEDAKVQMTVTGSDAVIPGVRRLLYEMVFNLCDNAIKYNVPGGQVCVTVSASEDAACVAVRDTGIGIPEAHQSRVFERFYRVDKSHSKASGGTGLGLSIVKHAAAYHSGVIHLESRPGEGTEIRVTLPKE